MIGRRPTRTYSDDRGMLSGMTVRRACFEISRLRTSRKLGQCEIQNGTTSNSFPNGLGKVWYEKSRVWNLILMPVTATRLKRQVYEFRHHERRQELFFRFRELTSRAPLLPIRHWFSTSRTTSPKNGGGGNVDLTGYATEVFVNAGSRRKLTLTTRTQKTRLGWVTSKTLRLRRCIWLWPVER